MLEDTQSQQLLRGSRYHAFKEPESLSAED